MDFDTINFLAVQSTYSNVQIGIYRDNLSIKMEEIKKINASAELIPSLDKLLASCKLNVKNLSFIAVNQGPAPFTTLRVVIASMNGVAFAATLPLIGVDGIKALLSEATNVLKFPTVVMLDAFTKDVYYGFKDKKGTIQTGCKPIFSLMQEVKNEFVDQEVQFAGNAAVLYKEIIKKELGNYAVISELFPTSSLDSIALQGLEQWREFKGLRKQLLPLYLKKQWWHKEHEKVTT